jgi:hypothetical protein
MTLYAGLYRKAANRHHLVSVSNDNAVSLMRRQSCCDSLSQSGWVRKIRLENTKDASETVLSVRKNWNFITEIAHDRTTIADGNFVISQREQYTLSYRREIECHGLETGL